MINEPHSPADYTVYIMLHLNGDNICNIRDNQSYYRRSFVLDEAALKIIIIPLFIKTKSKNMST